MSNLVTMTTIADLPECEVPLESDYMIVQTEAGTQKIQLGKIGAGTAPEPVKDHMGWLTAGRVATSYDTLNAILADEKTVRQLFTVHDSVDYLIEWADSDPSAVSAILNAPFVQKWVNLRDYALDKMFASATVKSMMDSVGMYGYGELELKAQIPINPPASSIGQSSILGSGFETGYAFDGLDSTTWASALNEKNPYIQYKLDKSLPIKRIMLCSYKDTNSADDFTFYVSGSHDGSEFTRIGEEDITFENTNDKTIRYFDINEEKISYQYYRITFVLTPTRPPKYGATQAQVRMLQFYTYEPKGLVPKMTSDTAPCGTVLKNAQYDADRAAWHAFDKNINTVWGSTAGTTNNYIGYKFTNPACIKRVRLSLNEIGTAGNVQLILRGSNDGNTWEEIGVITTLQHGVTYNDTDFDVENTDCYLYYSVFTASTIHVTNVWQWMFKEVQFYGRSLNESVPVMTSNTEPLGECIGSGVNSSHPYYYAFDNDDSTFAQALGLNGSNDQRLGYCFEKDVKVLFAKYRGYDHLTFKFQYSDDNINWYDASDLITGWTTADNKDHYYLLNDVKAHKYWALFSPTNDGVAVLYTLQFYGLDYSEEEFGDEGIKVFYDHGLELATINRLYYTGYGDIIWSDTGDGGIRATGQGTCCPYISTIIDTSYDKMIAETGECYQLSSTGTTVLNATTTPNYGNLLGQANTDVLNRTIKQVHITNTKFVADVSSIGSGYSGLYNNSLVAGDYITLKKLWAIKK